MYYRTKKDSWIVTKFFGEREFYMLFEQKAYNLVEINGMNNDENQ